MVDMQNVKTAIGKNHLFAVAAEFFNVLASARGFFIFDWISIE